MNIIRTKPTENASKKSAPRRRANARSLTEEYAERRTRGIVNQAIWTLRIALAAVYLIVIGAFVANYDHQFQFVKAHTSGLTPYVVPAALDLLTIACVVLLTLPVLERVGKWVALGGLIISVGGSSALSAMAPGDAIGKWVAGGLVGMIAVGKIVTSFARIDFRQLLTEENRAARAAGMGRGRTRPLADRAVSVAKAKATRAAKKAQGGQDLDDPVSAVKSLIGVAPVSPAPAGK